MLIRFRSNLREGMKTVITHRFDDAYIEKSWKHVEIQDIEDRFVEILGKSQKGQSIEDDLFCILYLAFPMLFQNRPLGSNIISINDHANIRSRTSM
jgi:hypothetical protein